MDPFEPLIGRGPAAKQEQPWTTILDHRYAGCAAWLALAVADERERARAEAARARVPHAAGPPAERESRLAALRWRVGGSLVRAGERLQGVTATGAAMDAVPAGSPTGSG